MRYCSANAYFSVKEIDVGMTADVGTLQRLPRLIGEGMARELAYTGRKVDGSRGAGDAPGQPLLRQPRGAAARASWRSPARSPPSRRCPSAARKEMINYARDHSVADGLNYIATWNAAMLLSADLTEAGRAAAEGRPPVFRD